MPWLRYPIRSVLPRFTLPESGVRSPVAAAAVVLPEPFTRSGRSACGANRPGEVAKQHPAAKRHTHLVKIENVLAQSGGCEPLQLQPVARLGLVGDERSGRVQTKLRL